MKPIQDQPFTMCGRVVVRRIGTDTLLVPVSGPAAGGRVFPVNPSAECIWNCLSTGGTPSEAAARLRERFEVGESEALSDCVDCARQLRDQQLIQEVC